MYLQTTSMTEEMSARIRNVLPDHIVLEGGPLEGEGFDLFPEEWAMVRAATPKRLKDFATGRRYARQALRRLGLPPQPLVGDRTWGPAWPVGVVGSISHTQGYCAVVAARQRGLAAIGLDVERIARLEPELHDKICLPSELDPAPGQPHLDRERLAAAIFSIKEAVYKAYAPMTGVFLDFRDVRVTLNWDLGRFDAELVNALKPGFGGARVVNGWFGSDDQFVFGVCAVGDGEPTA